MSDAINSAHEKGISICRDGQEENCRKEPSSDGGKMAEKKPKLSEEVKSVLLFTATSVFAGYASFILGGVRKGAPISGTSLLLALGAMIVILLVSAAIVRKLLGKNDMKWIMGNGGAIYLFLWFVTWIIFYNAM